MLFKHGVESELGKASTHVTMSKEVRFHCGFTSIIEDVQKKGCDYYLSFATPAACHQFELDRLVQEEGRIKENLDKINFSK